MHAEASEEQWILIFLRLCQFYCFKTDLSLNRRLIISASRARQFSGFVYLGSPPTPCTGVKGTHGQARFYVGTGEFKVRWPAQKALLPTKPSPITDIYSVHELRTDSE